MLDLISSNIAIRILILLVIFGLVALVVIVASNFILRRSQVSRELASLGGDQFAPSSESLTRQRTEGAWSRIVKEIERAGLNLGDTAEVARRAADLHARAASADFCAAGRIPAQCVVPGGSALANAALFHLRVSRAAGALHPQPVHSRQGGPAPDRDYQWFS